MKDKIVLITGANGGLGKAAALEFAQQGATVVMLCRDHAKGEAARSEVQAKSSNANVVVMLADLGSQQSIRQFVEEFKQRYPRLDVLVNNAAVYKSQRTVTPDGLEAMFATNHLGHFLLTNLLLDRLKASPSARVINVTAPVDTHLDFDDLQSERKFSTMSAFGASKMGNLLFSNELAKRLAGTHVTSNALHPGLVRSTLVSEAPLPIRLITNLIAKSPEKAAQNVVYLASAPELEGVSDKFFKGKTVSEPDAYSLDPDVQRRLWDVSAQLVHLDTVSA